MPMWTEALHRSDSEFARRVLQSLIETGMLTPQYMEFARWLLRSVPPNAIVLTGGDVDTFASMAVQTVEGLRPDVIIVELGMLRLSWWVRGTLLRSAVLLPTLADSLVYREVTSDDLANGILAAWHGAAVSGKLSRPLVYAITAGQDLYGTGRAKLSGPFWLIVPETDTVSVDTVHVRMALEGLSPRAWGGSPVSSSDRSPVRRASTIQAGLYVIYVASRYAEALAAASNYTGARAVVAWAEGFAATAGLGAADVQALLEPLKKSSEQR